MRRTTGDSPEQMFGPLQFGSLTVQYAAYAIYSCNRLCVFSLKQRGWAELPATAVKYIRRIEELIGVPVALLSTSPERDDTILVKDPFSA